LEIPDHYFNVSRLFSLFFPFFQCFPAFFNVQGLFSLFPGFFHCLTVGNNEKSR